jgi:hypothetical protein
MVEFIDCTSLNFSYDVMGLVTVNYTVVQDSATIKVYTSISAGGQNFSGHIMNASLNPIIGSDGWYETNCTMIATT